MQKEFVTISVDQSKLEEIKKREGGQTLSDGDVANILQKMVKELTEEKESYEKAGREETANDLKKQLSLVEKFMPKMLSMEEIKNIILSLEDKSIPSVMKYFKMNYNGTCDMRQVQEVLKSL